MKKGNPMNVVVMIAVLMLSGCRDKAETDSFVVVNLLMNKGLINWYTPEQREVLRQDIERVLSE